MRQIEFEPACVHLRSQRRLAFVTVNKRKSMSRNSQIPGKNGSEGCAPGNVAISVKIKVEASSTLKFVQGKQAARCGDFSRRWLNVDVPDIDCARE